MLLGGAVTLDLRGVGPDVDVADFAQGAHVIEGIRSQPTLELVLLLPHRLVPRVKHYYDLS